MDKLLNIISLFSQKQESKGNSPSNETDRFNLIQQILIPIYNYLIVILIFIKQFIITFIKKLFTKLSTENALLNNETYNETYNETSNETSNETFNETSNEDFEKKNPRGQVGFNKLTATQNNKKYDLYKTTEFLPYNSNNLTNYSINNVLPEYLIPHNYFTLTNNFETPNSEFNKKNIRNLNADGVHLNKGWNELSFINRPWFHECISEMGCNIIPIKSGSSWTCDSKQCPEPYIVEQYNYEN